MLVVTRRRNEAIMIGDGIEIRVVRIGKDDVRLGISAPAEVAVHRREVYDEIRQQNQAAALPVEPGAGRRERSKSGALDS